MILTPDQRDLREEVRRLFGKLCTTDVVRASRNPDIDGPPAELWSHLATFGAFGIALPADVGGADGSLFELGLIHQEAGRVLCPTQYYTTVAAALIVDRLGNADQREKRLPSLVGGAAVAAHAVWDVSSGVGTPGTRAHREDDDGWVVSGTADFVGNADMSEVLVAAASIDAGSVLVFLSDPGALKMSRHRTFSHDVQCRVEFRDVRVTEPDVLLEATTAEDHRRLAWLRSAVVALQCMEMVGGAEAVLDRTAAYIRGREQFGRPIGSFQAAQHHVANMRIAVDAGRLAALQAMWLVSEGEVAAREVAIAKAKTGDAYKAGTLLAHQLHGGMGYMRETDLHLWSERAKTTELQFGASDAQLESIALLLELGDD